MGDWPGIKEVMEPYAWTGGGAILGRVMYHARQVQAGQRKPLGWVLLFDVPIAIAMGWIVYGLCVYFGLPPEPTISVAIASGYLGPWAVDRTFAALYDRVLGGLSGPRGGSSASDAGPRA